MRIGVAGDPTRLGILAAVLATALALGGCSTGPVPDPDPTSSSASPSPSPTMSTPSFSDLDGVWCSSSDSTDCIAIDLPKADYGSDLVIEGPTDTGEDPCISGVLKEPGSDTGIAAIVYCPAGYELPTGWQADVDNEDFDRIFVTQFEGGTPYFRQDEWDEATQR
jgi:hypothetical protein